MFTTTSAFVIGSVVLFLIGLSVGLVLTRLDRNYATPSVQTAVALLITVVWISTITAEIVVPAYTVSVMIHGIMGTVVGYLFSDDGLTVNIGADE